LGKIKPHFNKKIPGNAGFFFGPASDDEFKWRHPFAYGVLIASGIAVILLPLIVFVVFTDFIYPMPDSGWIVLGLIGSLLIGAGLFNIVAAWIKQYLGHLFTIACFLIGGGLVALCCLLLYNVSLYSLFDESMVTYYFATILLLLIPAINYVFFRSSLKTWINHHIKKTLAKNTKQGKKNFWWYEDIHSKTGLGWKYHINKAFTITFAATLGIHILFGWIKIITLPVMAGSAATYVMAAVMTLYSRIQDNIDYHGRPFVLLARSANGGIDSVLFDILSVAFPLVCGYAQITLLLDVFSIR